MRRLEDPVPSHVVDVRPGCDPDAPHLGGNGVREIVAVEVGRGDHVEIFGAGEDLLQGDVSNVVLYQDLVARLATAIVPADGYVRELLLNHLVTPFTKCALCVLLNVPLVDQRHRVAAVVDCVLQGRSYEPLATGDRDRLYPDPGVRSDLPAELVVEQFDEAFGLRGALFDLEAGVDVLCVLPEDDHVDQLGVAHR